MWENRDLPRHLAGTTLPGSHVNGCTAYAVESGRDVVYVGATNRYSTNLDLYRYQLTDIANPSLDQMSKAGSFWAGTTGSTTCAFDPDRKLFVRTGGNQSPFWFWDLTNAGEANLDQTVDIDASIATLQSWLNANNLEIENCALEFDPVRRNFLLWCGAATIWELSPPSSGNTTSGWTIVQRSFPPANAPPGDTGGTGVLGKWRYAPYFDVFVGLENPDDGNVWIYKPIGWQQPDATPINVALTGAPNPSTVGATVTFMATVTGSAPTGSVSFSDGGVAITGCPKVALSGSGSTRTSICTTSAFSVGTHSVVATYSGDGANAGSGSNVVSQSVNKNSTTTGIANSSNPSTVGTSVTFTATVTGAAPTGTVGFTDGGVGIAGCVSAPLGDSGNIRTARCTTGALTAGSHSIGATYSGDANNAASSAPVLNQVVIAISTANVALAANGGVASASSTPGENYPASAVNNGDLVGKNWGHGGGWADATSGSFPDWVQIDFNATKTISRVVVYSLQDDYGVAGVPTDTTRLTAYGVTDFTVRGWNGAAWVTLASVSDNALIKRTVSFSAFATDRIRINVTAAFGGFSRIVEIQAWGN